MKTYTPFDNEYECPECGGIIEKGDIEYNMDSETSLSGQWIAYDQTCPHCGRVFRLFELTEVTAVEIWRVDE